ncbi:MAG: hypothetical protein V1743_03915 [Nanoarchaeota archaeon]
MESRLIAVDAMSAERGLDVLIKGVELATKKEIGVILYGDHQELEKRIIPDFNLFIEHTSEVVGPGENPFEAFRKKKDSSLYRAVNAVTEGCAFAVLSAGNTGAFITTATLAFRRINFDSYKFIGAPPLITCFPTKIMDTYVLVCDVGANPDCTPQQIVQNAILADEYTRYLLKKESPRIGLLSNGTERIKGNNLVKEADLLLRQQAPALRINYQGYAEPQDIIAGVFDTVITDGFTGNIILKFHESARKYAYDIVEQEMRKIHAGRFFGSLLRRAGITKRLSSYLHNEYCSGAILLGLNKPAMKVHANADAETIGNALVMLDRHQGMIQAITPGIKERLEVFGQYLKANEKREK